MKFTLTMTMLIYILLSNVCLAECTPNGTSTGNCMKITKNRVVSIQYTLTDDDGNVLDATNRDNALMYLHGAGNIIAGLEKALENKTEGDILKVSLEPKDAYGMRDETLIKQVQRSDFDSKDNLQLGMQYNAQTEDGRPFTVTIVDINGDTITIDGNHALAGKRLHYDVTVESVREANEGEISRGHVLR